jgi:hypothetical protein
VPTRIIRRTKAEPQAVRGGVAGHPGLEPGVSGVRARRVYRIPLMAIECGKRDWLSAYRSTARRRRLQGALATSAAHPHGRRGMDRGGLRQARQPACDAHAMVVSISKHVHPKRWCSAGTQRVERCFRRFWRAAPEPVGHPYENENRP